MKAGRSTLLCVTCTKARDRYSSNADPLNVFFLLIFNFPLLDFYFIHLWMNWIYISLKKTLLHDVLTSCVGLPVSRSSLANIVSQLQLGRLIHFQCLCGYNVSLGFWKIGQYSHSYISVVTKTYVLYSF